jgi:hypothetical protein
MLRLIASVATLIAVTTSLPAQCQNTVVNTTTSHGVFCTWLRYCYRVCVPGNNCTPVIKFCVDFPDGVDGLTAGSAPPGWDVTFDTVGRKVCWTMTGRGAPITQGTCADFCVETPCWPLSIPGRQNWRTNDSSEPRHNGLTVFASPVGVLNSNGPGNLGSQRTLMVADSRNPFGLGLLYVSTLPAQIPVAGLGELLIDPNQAAYSAALPLDADGRGQTMVQVPPQPSLIGLVLYYQSLQVPDVHLSGRLVFPVQ